MIEEKILNKLRDCVVNLDIEGVKQACEEVLSEGIPPIRAVAEGMAKGMDVVGQKFERGEYFLTELIMAGEVMKEGMAILKPHFRGSEMKSLGKVVLGTVKGDLHDIGKDVVATLLKVAGFDVINLGVDVPSEKFIESIRTFKARILGMSALLTTTMQEMENVISGLKKASLRNKVKVIIGGAPLTEAYAKKIGADAYARDAVSGVSICKKWLTED